MYEWLVAQMGADVFFGVALSVLALLLSLFFGIIFILRRRPSIHAALPFMDLPEKMLDAIEEVKNPVKLGERQDGGEQRLTLCDSVMIDEKRRLVLVRRDDVEHLILVGGAEDMVIEHNIQVETEAVDAVSMLAITRVENADFAASRTPFMALGDEGELADSSMIQGQNINNKQEKNDDAALREEDVRGLESEIEKHLHEREEHSRYGEDLRSEATAPLTFDDLADSLEPFPKQMPRFSNDEQRKNAEIERLVKPNEAEFALNQKSQGLAAIDVVDATVSKRAETPPIQVLAQDQAAVREQEAVRENEQQKNLSPELAMASLFPGSMTETMPVASSLQLDSAIMEDPANSLNAMTEQVKNKIQEPPVASYFAGHPKRKEQPEAALTDSVKNSIQGEIKRPASAQSSTVGISPRILPLNPFIQQRLADGSPPTRTPPMSASSAQPNQANQALPPPLKADIGGMRATPPPSPAPSLNVVNSFLGLSLGQVTKKGDDITGSAAPISVLHQENTPSVTQRLAVNVKSSSS